MSNDRDNAAVSNHLSLSNSPTACLVQRDVATAKRASASSSDSKKPETTSSATTSEIYSWASQLASESRKLDWIFYWYVWPEAVSEIINKPETMDGGDHPSCRPSGVGE